MNAESIKFTIRIKENINIIFLSKKSVLILKYVTYVVQ